MLTKHIKKVLGTLVILLFVSAILATPFNKETKVFASTVPGSTSSTMVVEETVPTIIGSRTKEITIGSYLDIYSSSAMGLKATDGSGNDISNNIYVAYDDNYDPYTLGTYYVTYVAYDDNYNESAPYLYTIKVVNTKTVYHYYTNGKVKDKTIYKYNSYGDIASKIITKYNSLGIRYDYDKYSYDILGERVSSLHYEYFANGNVYKKQSLKYHYGNQLEEKINITFTSTGVRTAYHKYTYDMFGDSTGEIIYDYYSNGNVKWKKVITCDFLGDKIYYTLYKYSTNKTLVSTSRVYY